MASKKETVEYIVQCASGAGEITCKRMFGEYGLYLNGVFVAMICDDVFFVKPTQNGRAVLKTPVEEPPYTGAKPSFRFDELENTALLNELLTATYVELQSAPQKAKKKKDPKSDELTQLPNIAEKLKSQLNEIGVQNSEQLRELGSKKAWLKIKENDPSACIHRLMALEGAVRGVKKTELEQSVKDDLKAFYRENKAD